MNSNTPPKSVGLPGRRKRPRHRQQWHRRGLFLMSLRHTLPRQNLESGGGIATTKIRAFQFFQISVGAFSPLFRRGVFATTTQISRDPAGLRATSDTCESQRDGANRAPAVSRVVEGSSVYLSEEGASLCAPGSRFPAKYESHSHHGPEWRFVS
jgi:hypothetical protein